MGGVTIKPAPPNIVEGDGEQALPSEGHGSNVGSLFHLSAEHSGMC